MTTFKLQAVPSKIFNGNTPREMDYWECETIINVENRYQISGGRPYPHKIGFSGSDNVHRETMGGPLMQRPHAYLIPLPIVISAEKREPEPSIEAKIGDIIVLENISVTLQIVDGGRYEDTKLIVIKAPAATVDHSQFIMDQNK